MNRIITLIISLVLAVMVSAQDKGGDGRQRFSPKKFKADMERFIVQEACLTPEESSKFFPIYNEMKEKQRKIFDRMRNLDRVKPTDNQRCKQVIQERDNLDIELKQIQQSYHNKLMGVISPSKLYDAIKAEDKFHRRMLRKYSHEQKDKSKK